MDFTSKLVYTKTIYVNAMVKFIAYLAKDKGIPEKELASIWEETNKRLLTTGKIKKIVTESLSVVNDEKNTPVDYSHEKPVVVAVAKAVATIKTCKFKVNGMFPCNRTVDSNGVCNFHLTAPKGEAYWNTVIGAYIFREGGYVFNNEKTRITGKFNDKTEKIEELTEDDTNYLDQVGLLYIKKIPEVKVAIVEKVVTKEDPISAIIDGEESEDDE